MEIIKSGNGGLMDIKEASEYLRLKVSTLYQMSMKKKISVVKVGRLVRFRKIDLDDFITKNLVQNEGSEIPC